MKEAKEKNARARAAEGAPLPCSFIYLPTLIMYFKEV